MRVSIYLTFFFVYFVLSRVRFEAREEIVSHNEPVARARAFARAREYIFIYQITFNGKIELMSVSASLVAPDMRCKIKVMPLQLVLPRGRRRLSIRSAMMPRALG